VWFNLQARSGYLLKASGVSWGVCKVATPDVYAGADLVAGKSYQYFPKPNKKLWRLAQSFLSFDARQLTGHNLRWVYLSLKPKTIGGGASGNLVVTLQGATPWGETLESADWGKCDGAEATLAISGLTVDTETRVMLDVTGLDLTGLTQIRISAEDETTEPTVDNTVTFYGADTGEVTLVANTGNILDDVCVTLADEVLAPYKSQLGVTEIASELLAECTNPPEIHVGFEHGNIADQERVSPVVYYINRIIPAGSASGVVYSRDRVVRQKADLIKRIIMADRNCKGLMSRLESIDISPILPPGPEYEGDWWVGAEIRPVYIRPMSVTDDVHVVG